ncbi:MAG: MinD/ParA family protein [Deltaproteobacteria bacterium]|nr:MinD/ParA family protein [Deltaproteobacteria bacterium]
MDQAKNLRDQVAKTKTHRPIKVISITSGKGGVGKTQVVANLALALKAKGQEVLIFDGDMGLANIDIIYNISPKYNLKHLMDGSKTIDEVIFNGPDNVKIIPAASGIQELTELTDQNKMALVDQIDQLEGKFDVVLIDTAAGISDNVMYLNSAAQSIFVVVTPEPTSITDAYALIKVMATRYGEKTFYIVTNQVRSDAEAKTIFNSLQNAADQFLDSVQLWHLHSFPYEEKVRQSIVKQQPMVKFDKDGAIAKSYKELAEKVVKLETNNQKGGMQFFLKQALMGK